MAHHCRTLQRIPTASFFEERDAPPLTHHLGVDFSILSAVLLSCDDIAALNAEPVAMQSETSAPDPKWPDELYELLRRHDVTQFAYVPDAGHTVLIDRSLADPKVSSIALTTEEEGVAMLAGADLGGARGVLLMQSSGAGNCVNILSMIKGGRFPFLTLISMRGDFGEGNPWQMPMGQALRPVLEAMGIICLDVDAPDQVATTVDAALRMTFKSRSAVAVLLTQKLIGAKAF